MSLNNQALQLQMAGSLSSQTSLFSQMNALLKTMSNVLSQLNTGFKALTQAILQNTVAMARISIGGVNAFQQAFGLKPLRGARATDPTLIAMDNLETAMMELFKPILDLVGTIDNSVSVSKMGANTQNKNTNPLAMMSKSFSLLLPQMAMLAIVTEPITAFIGALLEPFDMLSGYFEGFGSILSQIFVPILTSMQPLLDQMMILMQQLVPILTPIISLLFSFSGIGLLIQILTPLMPLITALVGVVSALFTVLTPVFNAFSSIIPIFMNYLTPALTAFVKILDDFTNAILGNAEKVKKGWESITSDPSKLFTPVQGDASVPIGWW